MDPFTQRMLDRTRQRREELAKKKLDTSPGYQNRKILSEKTNIAPENLHKPDLNSKFSTIVKPNLQHIEARYKNQEVSPVLPVKKSVQSPIKTKSVVVTSPVSSTKISAPTAKPRLNRINITKSEDDPLNTSINTRRNIWEKRINEAEKVTASERLKYEKRSPVKISTNVSSQPNNIQQETVPSPPPPPPIRELKNETSSTNVKKADPIKKQRLRNEFENKLKAMGFEVKSQSDNGPVASIDLTPYKKKLKHLDSPLANKQSTPTKAVSIEETKVVTTNFGSEKTAAATTAVVEPSVHKSEFTVVLNQGVGNPQQTSSRVENAKPRPYVSPTKVTNITPRPYVSPSKSISTPRATGTTIYNIIKQQTPGFQTPGPSSSVGQRQSVHDSFNSEDSYTDSEDALPKYQLQKRCSFESTQSESDIYSQGEETESQTETDHLAGNMTSEAPTTESDENTDSYSSEESDYTDESCSETGTADLSDYLGEAMDCDEQSTSTSDTCLKRHAGFTPGTSSTKRPVSYPDRPNKRASPLRTVYSPPHAAPRSSHKVKFRDVPDSPISSTNSQTVYSIDMYRNSKSDKNNPPPNMTIVRHNNRSIVSSDSEDLPYVPEKPVKEKLKELQEMVNKEQAIIQQTSNALNQCLLPNSSFAGSSQQIECNKLLLISCKRREAYIDEIRRLREEGPRTADVPHGSLTISDIRLPLKRDFLTRIGTLNEPAVVYFIGMVRHNAHIIITQMVSTYDVRNGMLGFSNLININDISADFRVYLEIYSMAVTKEMMQSMTPRKKGKTLTPKKLLKTKQALMSSPGGPNAVRSTNFQLAARMPINMRSLNKTHFTLDNVLYSSPLQGTIHLRLRCLMESAIEERGFLTMFEDVGGLGSWHRRWVVLKNNRLSYWRYPDDENNKSPLGSIDLKQCITETVDLIPRHICARPNTFELCTVRPQRKGDTESLTTQCYNTLLSTRHQLSADTKEDRIAWCEILNEALHNLRSWHSDALRPIKKS